MLFIEDGSSDDSWTRICALAARDARFRGIRLLAQLRLAHCAQRRIRQCWRGRRRRNPRLRPAGPPGSRLQIHRLAGRAVRTSSEASASSRAEYQYSACGLSKTVRDVDSTLCDAPGIAVHDRKLPLRRSPRRRLLCPVPGRNRVTFALVAWTGFREEIVEYHRSRDEPAPRAGRSGTWSKP